ncbi:MAG: hypothetical protein LBF84_03805 [Holosporales bacterium]|jgi:hypothetical protein|nr:hypothetical protein [Holosporales bacterium]
MGIFRRFSTAFLIAASLVGAQRNNLYADDFVINRRAIGAWGDFNDAGRDLMSELSVFMMTNPVGVPRDYQLRAAAHCAAVCITLLYSSKLGWASSVLNTIGPHFSLLHVCLGIYALAFLLVDGRGWMRSAPLAEYLLTRDRNAGTAAFIVWACVSGFSLTNKLCKFSAIRVI